MYKAIIIEKWKFLVKFCICYVIQSTYYTCNLNTSGGQSMKNVYYVRRRQRVLGFAMEKMILQHKTIQFSATVNYLVPNFTTRLTTLSALSSLVVRYHEFRRGYTAPCHHHRDIHGNLPLRDCDYPMILCPGQKSVLTDDIVGPKSV